MIADDLARIHAQSFTHLHPWTFATFEAFLCDPSVRVFQEAGAFLLGRYILDEAELLTLAVLPSLRRQGIAQRLMLRFERDLALRDCMKCYLEVAINNTPARTLYAGLGYDVVGNRKGYYVTQAGQREDALLLCKHFFPCSILR